MKCIQIKEDGNRCEANARGDGSQLCFWHGDVEGRKAASSKGGSTPKTTPVKIVERRKRLEKAPLWIVTLDEAFQEEDPLGGAHIYVVAETWQEVAEILNERGLYWERDFWNMGVCGDVLVVR